MFLNTDAWIGYFIHSSPKDPARPLLKPYLLPFAHIHPWAYLMAPAQNSVVIFSLTPTAHTFQREQSTVLATRNLGSVSAPALPLMSLFWVCFKIEVIVPTCQGCMRISKGHIQKGPDTELEEWWCWNIYSHSTTAPSWPHAPPHLQGWPVARRHRCGNADCLQPESTLVGQQGCSSSYYFEYPHTTTTTNTKTPSSPPSFSLSSPSIKYTQSPSQTTPSSL